MDRFPRRTPSSLTEAPYGRVILFRAADVPRLPEPDQTLGWKDVVQQPVEVVFVPGDHESMFHDPHVDFFSRRLRQAFQVTN